MRSVCEIGDDACWLSAQVYSHVYLFCTHAHTHTFILILLAVQQSIFLLDEVKI